MGTEHDNCVLKIVLNSESSALLKMSDMVGTVLSKKPRRLQRFRNESSFARSDAEQRDSMFSIPVVIE